MTDLVIRNAQVVTLAGVLRADVSVERGVIVAIDPAIGSGDVLDEIDASGCVVYPGLIDPHVHFNEPGRTDWEGITTGSSALVAGGGTAFFDMPLNSFPALLTPADFAAKAALMAEKSFGDYALWGGLTPSNLDQLHALADCGVIGFKAFMSGSGIDDFGRADEATLAAGMKIAAERGLIVAVHAEDETMTQRLTAAARRAGRVTWQDYVRTRPVTAELNAVEQACAIARAHKCKLHIVHISSPQAIYVLSYYRERDVDVTWETCPHYFMLNEADLFSIGARAKCAPPIRPETTTDTLWRRITKNEVDWLASDHSPAPPSMKTGDDAFAIWGGIAGVQSTLAAALTREPALAPTQIAALCAANVAERFGLLKKGRLEVGYDADLAIVDPQRPFTLQQSDLLDRHKQSPYVGRRFSQSIVRTILRGQTICRNGIMIAPPNGRLLARVCD